MSQASDRRKRGLRWLDGQFGSQARSKAFVSRYYPANKSWSKEHAWFFEFYESYATSGEFDHICLLCENAAEDGFALLRVPVGFFRENRRRLDRRSDPIKFSLILSAKPDSLYVDWRGKHDIDFSGWKVEGRS